MKRLVRELNQRAIELDSKIENAKSDDMEDLYSSQLMEVERNMKALIESGDAEIDQKIMQIKAVHYKIRESR